MLVLLIGSVISMFSVSVSMKKVMIVQVLSVLVVMIVSIIIVSVISRFIICWFGQVICLFRCLFSLVQVIIELDSEIVLIVVLIIVSSSIVFDGWCVVRLVSVCLFQWLVLWWVRKVQCSSFIVLIVVVELLFMLLYSVIICGMLVMVILLVDYQVRFVFSSSVIRISGMLCSLGRKKVVIVVSSMFSLVQWMLLCVVSGEVMCCRFSRNSVVVMRQLVLISQLSSLMVLMFKFVVFLVCFCCFWVCLV